MASKIVLGLTFLSYIALAIFNLQKINATGERLVGWGVISFGLIAAYVISSLLVTISIASSGGFNWMSGSASLRNLLIGLLWSGMIAGVVFCAMLSTEYHTDQSTGLIRMLSMPVYFGATWLPLLMLVPYAILLNPDWRESLSPGWYKVPLIIASLTGLLIVMAPKIVMTLGVTIPQKATADIQFDNITQSIRKESSIQTLLQYSLDEDERIRKEAAAKIKATPDWEGELIKLLEHTDQYGFHDFYWVYVFLDDHPVEHPDRFITPVNNTIPVITAEVQNILQKSFLYTGDLHILNIDGVCRVLEEQFNESSSVYRPNMLKLQEALETPPAHNTDISQEFTDKLNTYKQAVKAWLDSH